MWVTPPAGRPGLMARVQRQEQLHPPRGRARAAARHPPPPPPPAERQRAEPHHPTHRWGATGSRVRTDTPGDLLCARSLATLPWLLSWLSWVLLASCLFADSNRSGPKAIKPN